MPTTSSGRPEGESPTEALSWSIRVLRIEQKLKAYRELHTSELDELEALLEECKQKIARAVSDPVLDRDGSAPPSSDVD